MRTKKKVVKDNKRLERIEMAIINLALSIENGGWMGLCKRTADILLPTKVLKATPKTKKK